MPQNTNLNISPYFDDFNENKNYHKVLFKPGTPIQARELTTLQSILQNQVEKFGQHFFEEGAMVIPGQLAYDPDYTSVSINDSHLGIPVSTYLDFFKGKLIKGQESGVVAKVEDYITNIQSERNVYTLYVKYVTSSDTNFITNTFIDGETLITLENIDYGISGIRANGTFATTTTENSTSIGSAVKIAEGIYFIRGYFVKIQAQTVILEQYLNTPSYRVGLEINEDIAVASNDYDDLFDNAQGFSNFAAPGADRFVILATLIKKDINDFNDENFIELLRVRRGTVEKFVKNTNYSLIRDELARRTYDESGDYYIRPFGVSIKEGLNDNIGNNGIFFEGEVTRQGNLASEDLACLSISPGKAYVRGYEIETQNILFDLEKPRTTERVVNENIQFSLGNQLLVNNVYGSIPLGFTTTAQVQFYDVMNSVSGVSTGNIIGVSKVYDYEARSSEYKGPQTEFVVSLYDTQLFTKLKVSTAFSSLTIPSYIEGKNSGGRGFLYQSITNSDELLLYDVSGVFSINEPIRIDGEDSNRIIVEIKDYKIGDVHQVVANENNTGVGTFTANTVLNNRLFVGDVNSAYTITAGSPGGISTVFSTSGDVFNIIEVNDIVSYSKPGDTLPTYNRVATLSTQNNSFTLVSTPNVSGVSTGTLPTTQITTSDFKKLETSIINPSTSNFYLTLKNNTISNVDLSNTNATIKKTFTVNVSSSSFTFVLDVPSLSFEAFDEENYTLTYVNGGQVVSLVEFVNITFSGDRKSVTISGLSQTGNVLLTAACKINVVSTRKKLYNRCSSIVVNKSNTTRSGIGTTSLNDGLSYNKAYGTRVQDREISLEVPDVVKVLGIYESNDDSDPKVPRVSLVNISSSILNAIRGEKIIGETSNTVGYYINNLSSSQIEYAEVNENKFIPGENLIFEESKLTANIDVVSIGDKNIINSYELDSGHRDQYLDFSRIVRKNNINIPSKKVRVIFNHYIIPNNDSGDIVCVNSYDADRYLNDLPQTSIFYASDYLDLRPAVTSYSGNLSPFESKSRNFTGSSNSTPHIFSKNTTINLSYDFYLPRIDKLFLFKDGNFIISKGEPSVDPKLPKALDNALEIATINLPAYLRNVDDASLSFAQHKRYTMKDISRLEDRVSTIEDYTLLSLLEVDTKNLIIRDETTGLDRFKSGFFVDNFRSIDGGDILSFDYKSSIDTQNGILRPTHYTTSLDLLPGANRVLGFGNTVGQTVDLRYSLDLGSPSVKRVGDVICLNYNDVEYIKNPFATRTENVNPFNVINWVGSIELSPSSDTWVETRRLGDRNVGGFEGDYLRAIVGLGADINTGFAPIQWNSWETLWTGTTSSTSSSSNFNRNRPGGQLLETITTTTTTTTSGQQRSGSQIRVNERFDTVSLGDKVVSVSSIQYMRSRNIEIIARRLKPNTRFYAFFDNIDVTQFMVPKLIEVIMNSGTFIEGETITGVLGSKQIRFRLAKQNHKYGPVDPNTNTNLPPSYQVESYKNDIYRPDTSLPNIYSPTSTSLNVDTASLEINGVSEFFGSIATGMILVGSSSRASATVSNIRLISDEYGTFIGSLFIPDPSVPSTPVFETGTKTIVLSTSQNNSQVYGFTDSSGIGNFTSSGILESVEANTLRIRNADIETIERTDSRVVTNVSESTTVRYTDPLAQSFVVEDSNGIYLTKCDIFFRTKDSNNIPVTLQIRTVELGIPTSTILPFGEVTINPSSVMTSNDGKVATTFYFPSPIYLENGRQYSIVLLSASNEYNVWITRMGETEITTLELPESDRVIISQQPLLGSLFKSQNGSTWDPSQYEDLKFTLYRAEFTSNEATVRFYNPDLSVGNQQIVSLTPNPAFAYSRTLLVGIGKSLTGSDLNLLPSGAVITQTGNSYFRANLVSSSGAIGIGSTLVIADGANSFGTNTTTYTNVKLTSFTGVGRNATANLGVVAGVAQTVTIVNGGTGYIPGDILRIDPTDASNLGANLIISVPNIVGVISAYNSLLLTNVQGELSANEVISNGTLISSATVPTTPTAINDGLHLRISHNNHGMYSYSNNVTLSGIEPDVAPVQLTSNINPNSTDIQVSSVGILTTFENIPVDADNPGFILVNNEIIKYTGTNVATNALTGITRFNNIVLGSSDPLLTITYYTQSHLIGANVFKYEFNGISLNRINKTHNLNLVDKNKYPITLDSYHIKIDTGLSNNTFGTKDRSSSTGTNPLYFNITKFGGSYVNNRLLINSVVGPKATQNILMTSIRPNIQSLLPAKTSVSARIRTITGTSVSGNETSFVDRGFIDVSLNTTNFFENPRLIASKINENSFLNALPGKKSFTLELKLSTSDNKVSPMIDLDRVNIITTMNRIDRPVSNYITDERVNQLSFDPHASAYVSRVVRLSKPADALKVIFDAYRHSSNDIRVAYRLIRENIPTELQDYELFPGYRNLDNNKNTINKSLSDGTPDILVPSSTNINDYRNYEFTAKKLPQFSGYQIKIMMSGTSQSNVPLIRDFRAIATI